MGYVTECECGQLVKLRYATAEEAYQAGFDAVEDEYLIGKCHKLHLPDGTRVHYTKPTIVIHKSDATEV